MTEMKPVGDTERTKSMDVKKSMKEYLEGQIAKHTINAQIFMKNPVGVAEHPDTMGTIEEELGKIAEYEDKLNALNSIGYDYNE